MKANSLFKGLSIQYYLTIAIGIILLIVTKLVTPYVGYIITLSLIYAIATLTVSMLAHTSGIWTIGHTAFMALGAYLTANLSGRGFSVEMIIIISMAISLVVGLLIGMSMGRFSTLYMTIITQALVMVTLEVIGRWHSISGGDQGIAVPGAHLLFLNRVLTTSEVKMMTVVLAVLVFLVAEYVYYGKRGKRWLAIKSQRLASMSIGLKPANENALAFALSGALVSITGVCLAYTMRYISPEGFQLSFSIMLLLTSIVGGVGSIGGALLGGTFLATVPEMARIVPGAEAYIFGTATILVLMFLPSGVVPGIFGWGKRLLSSVFKKSGSDNIVFSEPLNHDEALNKITAVLSNLMTRAKETLIVEGLSVSFGGLKALDNVSLKVAPGQVVGLIGPNGAGKTTLLNVLSGYVPASEVRNLHFGETNLTSLPAYKRTAIGLGRTFQHSELFTELPIRESILQGALQGAAARKKNGSKEDPEIVTDHLIDVLRLRPYAKSYPTEVPFGIQKVTDIARALATGAQIIVMDEPFSGLDVTERDEVRAILYGMRNAGVSILIIDHVIQEVFGFADNVVVLDFGKVLAEGTPSQIRNDQKVQEAYLGSDPTNNDREVH